VRKRKGWEGCGTWRICITSDILLQFLHIYFQHDQLWTPGPATYMFKSINLDLSSALTHVKAQHTCTVQYLTYGTLKPSIRNSVLCKYTIWLDTCIASRNSPFITPIKIIKEFYSVAKAERSILDLNPTFKIILHSSLDPMLGHVRCRCFKHCRYRIVPENISKFWAYF
jgi:hypothetical protein